MKIAARVNPNTKTPGIFICDREGEDKLTIIDFDFNMIGRYFLKLSEIFESTDTDYIINLINMGGFGCMELEVKGKKELLHSTFSYSSRKSRIEYSKLHSKHYTYEHSKCGKYFLRIPTWKTYVNDKINRGLLLSKDNLIIYDYLVSVTMGDVAKTVMTLLIDLRRVDYANYKEKEIEI